MSIINGTKFSDQLGYLVVREQEGTAEIEVQDAPPLETREDAERWIEEHGVIGVDYWICVSATRRSLQRA